MAAKKQFAFFVWLEQDEKVKARVWDAGRTSLRESSKRMAQRWKPRWHLCSAVIPSGFED